MTQLAQIIGRSTTKLSTKLKILDNYALIKIHRESKKQISFILQAGSVLISEWNKADLGNRLTEEWKKSLSIPIDKCAQMLIYKPTGSFCPVNE